MGPPEVGVPVAPDRPDPRVQEHYLHLSRGGRVPLHVGLRQLFYLIEQSASLQKRNSAPRQKLPREAQ